MASTAETLQNALEHHRQGRLAEAEQLYRQVLQADPTNADALHLMGVIGTYVGKYELAVNFISQAIRLQGKHPAFHVNLSDALQRWGRYADALAAARQAVRLDPTYAEGHNSVGSVCKSLGRLDEALAAYTRAIDLKGDYVDAHYNRAMLRICMGDFAHGWDEYEWRWKRPTLFSRRCRSRAGTARPWPVGHCWCSANKGLATRCISFATSSSCRREAIGCWWFRSFRWCPC